MKLLTKNSDYAIRALVRMAEAKGQFLSSTEISQKNNIPLPFVRRILQSLTGHGLVESKEGMEGGVRLKKPPRLIRLIDVIEIFQGEICVSECLFRNRPCANRKVCVLRKRLRGIEQILQKEFMKITIAALVSDFKKT